MRNDINVHALRVALVGAHTGMFKQPLWFRGFKASFCWDCQDAWQTVQKTFSYDQMSEKTEKEQVEEFCLGFEAGLQLRKAVEHNQSESKNEVVLDDPLS